jgi:hypothetical protein
MSCDWKGALTAADVTCTQTEDGYVIPALHRGVKSVTTYDKGELASFGAFVAFVVMTSSGSTSASASPTPSSSSGSAVVTAASGASASRSAASGAASVSGSAAPAPSSGFAAAGPLPTGAMALVGGAVGIFAAALAL